MVHVNMARSPQAVQEQLRKEMPAKTRTTVVKVSQTLYDAFTMTGISSNVSAVLE
jgi:hypothetical protein